MHQHTTLHTICVSWQTQNKTGTVTVTEHYSINYEATEWYSPIVATSKKNSENIHMCIDLSYLNQYLQRERYMSPTPAETIADIAAANAKYFTVLSSMKVTTSVLLTKTANF